MPDTRASPPPKPLRPALFHQVGGFALWAGGRGRHETLRGKTCFNPRGLFRGGVSAPNGGSLSLGAFTGPLSLSLQVRDGAAPPLGGGLCSPPQVAPVRRDVLLRDMRTAAVPPDYLAALPRSWTSPWALLAVRSATLLLLVVVAEQPLAFRLLGWVLLGPPGAPLTGTPGCCPNLDPNIGSPVCRVSRASRRGPFPTPVATSREVR
jgi:hypothetical protein